LGIDGNYSGGNSIINIRAIGTFASGGFASSLNFILTNNAVQRTHASFFNDGNTQFNGDLSISGSNATKASGTAWINPSDIRLKKNIQPYKKGLSELLLINPKLWRYNEASGFDTSKTHLSPIAQELLEVMPEMISTYKGELNGEEIDLLQVDSSDITWLLVKAIQELNEKVNQLQNQTI